MQVTYATQPFITSSPHWECSTTIAMKWYNENNIMIVVIASFSSVCLTLGVGINIDVSSPRGSGGQHGKDWWRLCGGQSWMEGNNRALAQQEITLVHNVIISSSILPSKAIKCELQMWCNPRGKATMIVVNLRTVRYWRWTSSSKLD